MHELSIALSIVELAEEEAERRGVQVNAVHLKLGALSGVVKDALLSCYEMACRRYSAARFALAGGGRSRRDLLSQLSERSARLARCSYFVARNAVLPALRLCRGKNSKSLPWRYRNASRTPFD